MAKGNETKQEASNVDWDFAVEHSKGWKKEIFYPYFPMKEGFYSRTEVGGTPKPRLETDSKGTRLIELPMDPLDDYGKKLVLYFTGGKGLQHISFLKAFLCQNCGVADPEKYRWGDIIAALELYRESNQITQEEILKGKIKPDEITLKRSGFGKRTSKVMKLLEDLEGKRPGEAVTLDEGKHGKDAIKTLKRACPELAGKIHQKGKTFFSDIIIKLEA